MLMIEKTVATADLWQLILIHFCFLFPSSLLRYGGNLSLQSAMSVRFNSNGTQLLALRRRLPPVLYDIHSRLPVFQFDNQGYFNSCTMKSCCFAGDRDQYILSGSDDFNLYMWRIPPDPEAGECMESTELILNKNCCILELCNMED
ncbi:DDB1- and CUL4-associated factor 5-like [Ahaetulla prasina]|uniref:DDB1- and CUL4-associated factor 5-like n=1 Tax=Ahaetulla prasina TaxID=499056 RepID=UPI002647DB59|nr:DDB1- and CUL4-associated factor 5-like [Ahaetulla prasina]